MTTNKTAYSTAKLKKFEAIIEEQLNTTSKELKSIQVKLKEQKTHSANSNVDFNENSKHFQQQAKNKQHVRRLQRKSRELKDALTRVNNGTYGVCERTGKLIREERLLAMPTARFDIQSR